MRYAFAGDRQISLNLLNFLISKGFSPLALFVSSENIASHDKDLKAISGLPNDLIFVGNEIKTLESYSKLKVLELDYIFGIHFPYIISKELLNLPKIGFLNLHPAYLPYNKGWNTPTWAIIDKTPFGATLHFMSENLDEGDIIHQKQIEITILDTADTLYQKVLKLEEEVFCEAFDSLVALNPNRTKQLNKGTSHNKKDLSTINKLDCNETIRTIDLIDKIRALTTNNSNESAYLEIDGKRINLQIVLKEHIE